ncbi:N-formylglutamate amidohydrolase [Sphingomonas oligophenolica]|uniref:N-formylglutamate amidohydrolase n=1 Tax=Sphingomonas oligophenolica TaxID=301154 RepID=A0ABU9Y6N0_9SPHN
MVVALHRSIDGPGPGWPEASQEAASRSIGGFAFVVTVPHASGAAPHWQGAAANTAEWRDVVAGSHHALDRGAGELAKDMGARLGAPVIEGLCSRLFIDLNRPLDDPSVIASAIDGRDLMFNRAISGGDLASRRTAHRHYHQRVAGVIAAAAQPVYLVDQHSFDRFGPAPAARGVDIGVCAPGDDRFARTLLDSLLKRTSPRRAEDQPKAAARILNVRLNEPYSADHPGAYIMRRHMPVTAGGVVIEVCDDLLADDADVGAIAELLSEALVETASAMSSTFAAGESA